MTDIFQTLQNIGMIPVIKIDDPDKAVPLCRALADGGLPVAEITFRTPCAAEAIRRVHEAMPEILLAAGTVLTEKTVDEAIAAGASLIVSPGLSPDIVRYCQKKKIPVIPGCSSPSDVEAALALGLHTVKFFPAEAAGGLRMIQDMSAPYGDIRFMPTGGLNPQNILPYLSFSKVLCCGGSFMVKNEWIKNGDFETIRKTTEEAVLSMLDFHLMHIGINCENETEAKKNAALLSSLFGVSQKELPVSIFAGEGIELMKKPGRGRMGHIAIGCRFPDRALFYMARHGFLPDESTRKRNEQGETTFIYLQEEICGFAIHLVKHMR